MIKVRKTPVKQFVLIFLLCAQNVIGQNLDSLKVELAVQKELSQELQLLQSITEISANQSIDSTKKYANRLLEKSDKAKQLSNRLMQPLAYHLIGDSFLKNWKLDSAETNYKYAINLFQTLIDQVSEADIEQEIYWELLKKKANSYMQLGSIHFYMQNLDEAMSSFQQSIDLNKQIGEGNSKLWKNQAAIDIGDIYTKISRILERKEDYQKAIEYVRLAKNVLEKHDDKEVLRKAYNNLGCYHSFVKKYDSSIFYHQKALILAEQTENVVKTLQSKSNLGTVHALNGEFDKGIKYLLYVYDIYKKGNEVGKMWSNEAALTEAYQMKYQTDSSLFYLKLFLSHSEELGNIKSYPGTYHLAKQTYTALAKQTGIRSLYDSALHYTDLYYALHDSLFTVEKETSFKELEVKYETQKKINENQELKQESAIKDSQISAQRIALISVGIVLLILIVLAYVIYSAYKKRKTLIAQISDQKKQLEELDNFKSRFFANVSHDLRTPLTLIKGRIDKLRSDDKSFLSEDSQVTLNKLEQDNRQLTAFADEIQQLIALDEGKFDLKFQKVKVNDYFKTLITLFSSYADMMKIDLVFESSVSDEKELHLDPNNFQKVIYNLLSNAFKFTKKGGAIKLSIKDQSNGIQFDFSDTGVGIESSALPNVFERYYQADNEYQLREGLGIGLSLVKEIITLHGGSIEVSSTVGEGTTFTGYLPFNLDQPLSDKTSVSFEYIDDRKKDLELLTVRPADDQQNPIITTISTANKKTVLVVDDHPEVREYIKEVIEEDFNVLQAENGKHALEILQKSTIDIVVTDLMMPFMDGYGLLDAMRSDERLSKIPAMVVSARVSDEDKERVLEKGVNSFLNKPFDKREVNIRIKNIIESKGSNPFAIEDSMEQSALDRLNAFLLENIDRTTTVDEIASELATSERNLYRMVKELTGKTPLGYQKDLRFQYVKELVIKRKVRSSKEAAASIGIKNIASFRKQFCDRFGEELLNTLN